MVFCGQISKDGVVVLTISCVVDVTSESCSFVVVTDALVVNSVSCVVLSVVPCLVHIVVQCVVSFVGACVGPCVGTWVGTCVGPCVGPCVVGSISFAAVVICAPVVVITSEKSEIEFSCEPQGSLLGLSLHQITKSIIIQIMLDLFLHSS